LDSAAPTLPVYLLAVNWRIEPFGGVNQVVLNLARQLQNDSPYRPIIAELTWDHAPKPSATGGIPVVNLRARGLSGIRPILGWLASLPADLLTLGRFLREERVAAVNFHFPGLNTVVFFLLRWFGLYRGRLLLSFHGADITAIANLRWFYRMLWRWVINSADAVTTCSEALRNQLLAVAPHATRVLAIHNGVDPGPFDGNRAPREHRRTVLHIGKFEHKKSQDILLKAFHLLLKSLPDASLILVGATGPMVDTVREQISLLGLPDRVELHVDVPHERVPEFFDRADLFVLPSRAEPFGLALLEAGAAGVPVVAARVGGIPELVEDGVTGILVPAEDVAALEAAMRLMLTDPETATRMAQAWRDKVLACWSWRETCHRYLTLIELSARKA
jgi:glycosyltransferase involved in cell wall biosynthesis